MGIAQAGLAFKPTSNICDLPDFISNLTGENAIKIAHPNAREFDIRKHTDVMVEFFGESCFIYNHDMIWYGISWKPPIEMLPNCITI